MCSTAMYYDVSEHNITADVTVFRAGEFSLKFFAKQWKVPHGTFLGYKFEPARIAKKTTAGKV